MSNVRRFVNWLFSATVPGFIPGAKRFNAWFNGLPLPVRVVVIVLLTAVSAGVNYRNVKAQVAAIVPAPVVPAPASVPAPVVTTPPSWAALGCTAPACSCSVCTF